jgi:hypothetical protein
MADDATELVTVRQEPLPATFTVHNIGVLCRDLAMQLAPEYEILKHHHLTPGQFETLKCNPFFQKMLEAAVVDWNVPSNTNKRLAMGAGVLLEESLPVVGARMMDRNEPLANAVQAFSALTKVAGIGDPAGTKALSERVSITINLGADTERIEKTRIFEVQSQPEGIGQPLALPPFREGDQLEVAEEPRPVANNITVPVQPQPEGSFTDIEIPIKTQETEK